MRHDSMSDGQPIVGIWYGCARYAVACTCSCKRPTRLSSTRSRRSECTTPRSLSITFGSNARLRRRSASTSNTVASAARGSQS